MKTIILSLFLMMSCVLVKAQQTGSTTKEETEVTAVVEKLRAAMISGNKTELESLVTDDLTYGHSSGKVQNKAGFVDDISSKRSDFKTIELTKQSVTIQDNIAIVRHILTADTNDGGKPAHITLGIVLVLKKQKKDWKIIARRAFHID
ncbi:nuclear transport factor 2 family protein [Pedobacter cryoconitis]|uniref:Ketosteroid isomerase-like protein n=1 Tax=Pedobacter cryoconitis TaxID=188932 RepID=A0A7X0JAH4_9SPHI|nr:nuclear transport factor 2 family protein [Pedobacter cryoconitis]MBB6502977.1 ketosteroid isomerase-like protein [Pedobacter cryoconitis]